METDDRGASGTGAPTIRAEDASCDSAEQTAAVERDTGWVDDKLKSILESLLFAAGEPVSLIQLANALEKVPREQIRKSLNEMAAEYASGRRGFLLEEIASGYQLRTPTEHSVYVRRLLSAKPPRLSRPLLEALAIVAYRQPITRPEIEQLRGVDSGAVLETLIERNLIKIAGRKDGPGRPILYTTTSEFLELFGLKGLENLPDLEEFRELEGLSEPAQAPQTPYSDEQNLGSGAAGVSSISPADEFIDKTGTAGLVADNAESPIAGDEHEKPENREGPEESN